MFRGAFENSFYLLETRQVQRPRGSFVDCEATQVNSYADADVLAGGSTCFLLGVDSMANV